jgi:hypothetical protein
VIVVRISSSAPLAGTGSPLRPCGCCARTRRTRWRDPRFPDHSARRGSTVRTATPSTGSVLPGRRGALRELRADSGTGQDRRDVDRQAPAGCVEPFATGIEQRVASSGVSACRRQRHDGVCIGAAVAVDRRPRLQHVPDEAVNDYPRRHTRTARRGVRRRPVPLERGVGLAGRRAPRWPATSVDGASADSRRIRRVVRRDRPGDGRSSCPRTCGARRTRGRRDAAPRRSARCANRRSAPFHDGGVGLIPQAVPSTPL